MKLEINKDKSRLNVNLIHDYLCNHSYWAKGVTKNIVERSIQNSECYGAFLDGEQIGFGRTITDSATFAYLCDVFILPPHSGKGYGKLLVEYILDDEIHTTIRKMLLRSSTAKELYRKYGFTELEKPEIMMERKFAE
ncbi:MAG: GNAT family N-acetyltransferase [Bacteroidetes bacterium]|nr:GNAT family N-acetyltransferase [Bacteroidota bacterium]